MADVLERPPSIVHHPHLPTGHAEPRGGQAAPSGETTPSPRRPAAREILAALLMYATNHIVAHVPLTALRHAWYHRVLGWEIGSGATIHLDQRLITSGLRSRRGTVSLGAGTVIEEGCVLQSLGPIHIGAHVMIGPGALLLTGGHDINHPHFALVTAPITIEDDVCIGPKAVILSGVTVGRGAVIAPQAVVTKSVPPFAVVVGSPAREIGRRSPEASVHEPLAAG